MSIEDRLSEAFQAKAETARISPDAFTTIRDRVQRRRRLFMLELAGAALAVPAVVAVALVVSSPATREPGVVNTPLVTTTSPAPSPTADASPTPDHEPTPSAPVVIPPPPDDPDYSNAIAVGRPGGIVDLMSPSGDVWHRIATKKRGTVERLAWTPDRKEVYVSTVIHSYDADCPRYEAIAIDARTGKLRQLGTWSDFAFSSDGSQLAVVDKHACDPASLLVRNLTTGKERRIPAASGDDAGALFANLAWVPGVDRLVLVQNGPGDSTDLWLIDLSTAKAINDGTRLEVGDDAANETVSGATYAGNRLVVALICCLNTPERLRLVERVGTTGEVRELLVVPNRWGFQVHASPDEKSVAFVAATSGGQQQLWVWPGAGDPEQVTVDVEAIAW